MVGSTIARNLLRVAAASNAQNLANITPNDTREAGQPEVFSQQTKASFASGFGAAVSDSLSGFGRVPKCLCETNRSAFGVHYSSLSGSKNIAKQALIDVANKTSRSVGGGHNAQPTQSEHGAEADDKLKKLALVRHKVFVANERAIETLDARLDEYHEANIDLPEGIREAQIAKIRAATIDDLHLTLSPDEIPTNSLEKSLLAFGEIAQLPYNPQLDVVTISDTALDGPKGIARPKSHTVLLINRANGSTLDNPNSWGDKAVICDPEKNRVYRPKDDAALATRNLSKVISLGPAQLYDPDPAVLHRDSIDSAEPGQKALEPVFPNKAGLSHRQVQSILKIPKGERPDPNVYLSKQQYDDHMKQFSNGAVRFTERAAVETFGTAGPPGGFVMPLSEFQKMETESKGDLSVLETELGLEPGHLISGDYMAVYISPDDFKNIRMPSGNESGANEFWRPGGYTSGGIAEAVMDFDAVPFTEIELETGK